MTFNDLKAGLVSFSAALVASLCCLLPLAVVALGLGSGAFMITTMKYRGIFLPVGIIGVAVGYLLYFREKRRCNNFGCSFVGRKTNFALLLAATIVVSFAIILDVFPAFTSTILQRLM